MDNQAVSLSGKLLSGLLIALLIGIALYVVWMSYAFPVHEQTVPYWLYRSAVDDSKLFCIGIIPLGWLIAALHIFIWQKRRMAFLLILISIILSCTVMGFTARTIFLTVLGRQRHHDTLATEAHVYHLSSEWKIGVGMASRAVYLLWQCDQFQIACSIVHSERIPPIYPEEEYEAANAMLEHDSQTGEIDVILDDEIIYTFAE